MTASSELFSRKLAGFAAYLRKQGMHVGLGEVADMACALNQTGFENRETVRIAMKMLCAKTSREQEVFDQCFDQYFVSEEEFQKNAQAAQEAEALFEEKRRRADEELQFNGKPIDLRDDLKDVYAKMPQSERDKLQSMIERYSENTKRSPNLYEGFIRSVFMRSLLEQQMALEDAAEGAQTAASGDELLFREISNFKEEEIPRAYQMIDQITRQINGSVAARKRAAGRSDRLDFKKTIRAGLSAGGSLAHLHYKRKPRKKKRVVLLCDVSGSMLQFSFFAIRFIKSMQEISDHSEAFLFSEQVMKIGAFAMENMDAFSASVRHSGVWGKGTNVGRALEALLAQRPPVLGPSTVLIVLSDAKTVDLARAENALMRAEKLAGSVVWMNPIPESKWQYLRGVTSLKRFCNMVPCATLDDLARACARLV